MQTLGDFLAGNPLAVLGLRMALVAAFVVMVALVAERLGAFLGAMVASLPLYTGPVYLMLAFERDAAWFAEATLGSIAVCGIMPMFMLVYCALAMRRGVALSLGGAVLAWSLSASAVTLVRWSLLDALLFVAPIYVASVWLAQSFTRGIAPARAERRWGDLVLRAVLVATLSGFTIWISAHIPAQAAGVLSVAPILTTSLILVLHPRIGGQATAALLAHTLSGLVGMVLAFALVHVLVRDTSVLPALGAGLAVTLAWNLMLVAANRLRRRRTSAATTASAVPAALPTPQPPSHRLLPTPSQPPRPLPPPRRPGHHRSGRHRSGRHRSGRN